MGTADAENVALVERLYGALERDDLAAALEICAPDVEWRYPAAGELPYGGAWRRRDGVVAWAEAHDEAEEILDFRLDEILAAGDRAVVLGFFRGRANETARVWETRFVHVITVRGRLVAEFEAYFDTAAAVSAHRA